MSRGLVYLPAKDSNAPDGQAVVLGMAELPRLFTPAKLSGQYVDVRNGGWLPPSAAEGLPSRAISPAQPNGENEFLHRPGRGGARLDRPIVSQESLLRSIEASHFAEVNTYFHIDRIADYIHSLLTELGAAPLPRVIAVVNAHDCVARIDRSVDGVKRRNGWTPFQGAHYRLPGPHHDVIEHHPVSPDGEIHLGPGRRRLSTGALARRVGKPYRHNAGHNAGIIYHEYGHHIHRHTADFRTNSLRPPLFQSNRKTSMDEGTCDYWAAVMLDSPHIWAWHRQHDDVKVHRRSLISSKTMADYDRSENADPHANGTIWGAALWEFRRKLRDALPQGGRLADLIVLQGLRQLGSIQKVDRPKTCRARSRFRQGLAALLEAEQKLSGGTWQTLILELFFTRGISVTASRGSPS